jgi:hypothetical protein
MADLLPSVDSTTFQFPDAVRGTQAANLASPATPEGAAVDEGVADRIGDSGSATSAALTVAYASRLNPLGTGADDVPRLQAAIDGWAAQGGRSLMLGGGTWRIGTTIVLPTNFVLQGSGRRATLLKALDGTNLSALIKTTDYDSLVGTSSDQGVRHSGLMDLTLDGNKANNPTGGDGFAYYGALSIIERVHVRYCMGAGIRSEWSPTATIEDGCEGSLIAVSVSDNTDGIVWKGPHDTTWVHCLAFRNTNIGFWIKSGSAIHVAIGCHSWGVQQTYAWYIESETHLVNCQGEGASVAQLMIGANNTTVLGGKYFYALTDASPAGIRVGDATHASPTGVEISTQVSGHLSSAVDFTYAGSNGSLTMVSNLSAANAVLASPSSVRASWVFRITNSGSGTLTAGDALNIPGSVTMRGGSNALQFPLFANFNQSSKQFELFSAPKLRVYSDNYTTKVWELDGANGHITTAGTAPAIAVAAGAGTGATASISGTDSDGVITINTGTSPSTGTQVNVTFASGFSPAPKGYVFEPQSAAAAVVQRYQSGISTTVLSLGFAVAPAASTQYKFAYKLVN